MMTSDEMATHTNGKKPRYWFMRYRILLYGRVEERNMVTNEHPLDWLADYHENISRGREHTDGVLLMDYKEISKEHYERLREFIG